jgi:transposase
MKTWKEITHCGGLDWAKNKHYLVILNAEGRIVAEFGFEHSAEGWSQFREKLRAFPAVAIAVETNQGAAVENLLQTDCTVYPVNPRSACHYRERKRPSGDKTDAVDAWGLADALRLEGATWKPLTPEDPHIVQLRLLCRDEMALIAQRTALVNQLQQALYEYYPAALEAFEEWTQPAAWAFVAAFPTTHALIQAGRRKWEKFLHVHRLWRPTTAEKRLEIFARADQFCGAEAVTAAKSRLALTYVPMLQVLQKRLDEYRVRIEELFRQHPDHQWFGSLPGAGAKLAPRLFSEIGSDRGRFEDANGLQCLAGTAPVRYQSGQINRARLRYACNKHLRYTVHLWADLSRASCPWAQSYYEHHREKGRGHADALRRLGNRWLKILWKMWQTRTCYDADQHTRNQTEHGSWVLKLENA